MVEELSLRLLRAELRQYVTIHHDSLVWFYNEATKGFFRTADVRRKAVVGGAVPVQPEGEERGDGRVITGLTTAFTCYESLLDATHSEAQLKRLTIIRGQLSDFANRALERPQDWESEGAAKTYCRVRSLAPLFRHCPDLDAEKESTTETLLREAWAAVRPEPGRDGVFEVGRHDPENPGDDHYPPNAYLSYWALEALYNSRDDVRDSLADKRAIVELWLEKWLGMQVSLHAADSPRCDPQQMAWAVAGLLIARDEPPEERPLPVDELIRAGLLAFFARQRSDGLWERGDPLFHYPAAGNAYSYPYEALAVVVNYTLGTSERSLSFREQLRPYLPKLAQAYRRAALGARILEPGQPIKGWSSGHHPFRTTPESWATASVFRFVQALRKFVGVLSREQASRRLRSRVATEDLNTLADRGRSWNAGWGSAGVQLASMFVQPIRALSSPDVVDPDLPVLPENYARSALLYGPPGTSKTTLIESIAGTLGWPFVEISPAAFLDQGVDMVSARADTIFDDIMELDHAVVLLDEIDELIRSRTNDSDPIERFFTTTMLPRLAKLWKQRRILFIVNTNSIVDVDPAVMRSQRFDAAIFVLSPSFQKKQEFLLDQGVDVQWDVDYINRIVNDVASVGTGEQALAWLPFIRWDQMKRLSATLAATSAGGKVGSEEAAAVLQEFGRRDLVQTDWPLPRQAALDPLEHTLQRYHELAGYQRRDADSVRVVALSETLDPPADVEVLAGGFWRVSAPDNDLYRWARQNGFWMNAAAVVHPRRP